MISIPPSFYQHSSSKISAIFPKWPKRNTYKRITIFGMVKKLSLKLKMSKTSFKMDLGLFFFIDSLSLLKQVFFHNFWAPSFSKIAQNTSLRNMLRLLRILALNLRTRTLNIPYFFNSVRQNLSARIFCEFLSNL